MFGKRVFSLSASGGGANLVGRHLIAPSNLNSDEYKSLLWTALELRAILSKGVRARHVRGKRITLLLKESCVETQASVTAAAAWLNAHVNVIVNPKWDAGDTLSDTGKYLCLCSDIVLCQTKAHSMIEKLKSTIPLPVVTIRSYAYNIPHILSDIMTMHINHGYLQNLIVSFIGSPCTSLNTYLCVAPSYGIHVRYCCSCPDVGGVSPARLRTGLDISRAMKTRIVECESAQMALQEADVVVVCHAKGMRLTRGDLRCRDGRKRSVVCNEAVVRRNVDGANDIGDQCIRNLQWIYAAIILRLLSAYEHLTPLPQFIRGRGQTNESTM